MVGQGHHHITFPLSEPTADASAVGGMSRGCRNSQGKSSSVLCPTLRICSPASGSGCALSATLPPHERMNVMKAAAEVGQLS